MNETKYLQIIPPTVELESPQVILVGKIAEVAAECMAIEVKDERTSVIASDALTRVRAFLKGIDEEAHAYIKPRNDFIKNFRIRITSLCGDLVKAQSHLTNELLGYRQRIESARQKEQARLDRLAQKRFERAEAQGKPSPIPEAISPVVTGPPKSIRTDIGGVSFRQQWHFVVTNPDLIPKEYWDISQSRLDAAARNLKEKTNIPGGYASWEEVPVTRMR